jgi:hypothetical protein
VNEHDGDDKRGSPTHHRSVLIRVIVLQLLIHHCCYDHIARMRYENLRRYYPRYKQSLPLTSIIAMMGQRPTVSQRIMVDQ